MPEPARKWSTLIVVCVGIFMLLLDITVVNIALPDLVRALHASFSDLQWVIDAYALSLAALLLICGSLGDLVGARAVFLAGLAVFCVSSLLCGIAQSPGFLITFRAVQGVGGAAMFATSLALLAHNFRGRDRGVALGVWGGTAGAAIAVGPLIGGALTSGISWRWIFLVNVPIGFLAFIATLIRVSEAPRRPGVRPDWPGFITLSGAMVAGVYALIRGNPDGWGSTRILAAFATCAVLLVLFIIIEHRRRQPMLELRLFRNPALVGASIGALALSATIFSILLYLVLYLQNILGYSAFQTGVRVLAFTVPIILVAPVAGWASAHLPHRVLIGAGLGLIAVGLGLMTAVSPASGWTALLAGLIVSGVGSGLTNPALASAAVGTVGSDEPGVGSGINNTFRQLGIAVGIAGLGAIFQRSARSAFLHNLTASDPRLASRAHTLAASVASGGAGIHRHAPSGLAHVIESAGRAAFVTGLDRILWICVIVAAIGAVFSAVLLRARDISTAPPSGIEEQELARRTA